MCVVMVTLAGIPPTRANIRAYQAEQPGRAGGETLLAELMPIPKPKVHRWDYEDLLPQFASREEYYAQVKPQRIEMLRGSIAEHKRRAVIAYGKGFWHDYRRLFTHTPFEQIVGFEVARLNHQTGNMRQLDNGNTG